LTWSIGTSPEWIMISNNFGYLYADETTSIKIKALKQKLLPSTYSTSLIITTNNKQKITIPVTVQVPAIKSIETSKKNIVFDYFQNTYNVVLRNTGNTDFSWTSVYENYYTLSPSNGTLSKGDSTTIQISLKREILQTATYTSDIIFNAGNTTCTLSSSVKNFRETKKILPMKIIDAEFCRESNKIIAVSSNPHKLSIIDPVTNIIESIDLNMAPVCVAVNKANTKAVVAHNGRMSLIDLRTKSLVEEYILYCEPLDIMLSSSDWAYICPGYNGEAARQIHCLDLSTGKTTFSTQGVNYFSNMIYAKMDPTEKFIYGVSFNSFPSNLHKFDISNYVADYMYSSPYHGDYEMSNNLWISEDGDKILTKGKSVFQTGNNKNNDMLYIGALQNTASYYINYMVHSKIKNRVYAVTFTGNTAMEYDYSSLTVTNQYPLEDFIIQTTPTSGTVYNANGKYIFINSSGTDLYILTKPTNTEVWALQSFKL
jgi:hypothetical protein